MELQKEIEKNFPKIEKLFSEEALSEFINTPINQLERYNAGLGSSIRVNFLRPRSILYKRFVQKGYDDKDIMAMEVIRKFYTYMRLK